MIEASLAKTLTDIASKQLEAGLKMKEQRMKTVQDVEDLYNNKVMGLADGRINIPFPIMAGHIDTFYSKIDNPPRVNFRLPTKPDIAEKTDSAWKGDSSSSKAGWSRKDRAEKKLALFSGRGIAKIYASSVNKQYKSHYEVVDHRSFVCEGTRGHLEDQLCCGEIDIFKTKADLEAMAKLGIYDKTQVNQLLEGGQEEKQAYKAYENKWSRMKSLGLNPEDNAYAGQKVFNLAEWYLEYEGCRYYLLFDPKKKLWIRAEKLKDIFANDKWPYVSWAVNYDEYNFWTKGIGDDMMPIAEAMRLILNETLENARRRNRPMRIVESGQIDDVNQLLEYIPDNVIVANAGRNSEIITLETPEISASINLVEFLDNFMGRKTGVTGALQGESDQDTKVGVYYGTLQQAADRIGSVNKEYSESYAEKAYRYFWGLKQHLTKPKAIEMLGKFGYTWEELKPGDLKDVDDVDDIIVSGGSSEEAVDEVKKKRRSETLSTLTGNPALAGQLNPRWIVKTALKEGEFTDDDIQEAMDKEGGMNHDLMVEADQAIQQILEGKMPRLNRGANIAFVQRIADWEMDNINYIKEDGTIDAKQLELSKKIKGYAFAHMDAPYYIVQQNLNRDLRMQQAMMMKQMPAGGAVNLPVPNQSEVQQDMAQPFENPAGVTPEGTASTSQAMSEMMSQDYGSPAVQG